MRDVIVVGGGVIGMMSAWRLAQAGLTVTLVERGRCAGEASWAGGGIVSPLYPWRYSAPVSALSALSEGVYPALCRQLYDETGVDPQFTRHGLLYLAVDDAEDARQWAQRFGKPLEDIDADAICCLEPGLAETDWLRRQQGGLWMPTLGSLRNPRLGRALRARLERDRRVEVRVDCEVIGFRRRGDDVVGVETVQGRIDGGRILVCGGAWSGELLRRAGVGLAVNPVKGQMMVLKPPYGTRPLSRVVLADGRYLIPRRDGRILVGSTLEHQDFDKTTTSAARVSLYRSAVRLLPALSRASIEHHWAGLRPGSPGGIPFIGEVPGWAGLHVNAGHFRNGLVLAPAAARLGVELLLGERPCVDPAPYRLGHDAHHVQDSASPAGLAQSTASNWC